MAGLKVREQGPYWAACERSSLRNNRFRRARNPLSDASRRTCLPQSQASVMGPSGNSAIGSNFFEQDGQDTKLTGRVSDPDFSFSRAAANLKRTAASICSASMDLANSRRPLAVISTLTSRGPDLLMVLKIR